MTECSLALPILPGTARRARTRTPRGATLSNLDSGDIAETTCARRLANTRQLRPISSKIHRHCGYFRILVKVFVETKEPHQKLMPETSTTAADLAAVARLYTGRSAPSDPAGPYSNLAGSSCPFLLPAQRYRWQNRCLHYIGLQLRALSLLG